MSLHANEPSCSRTTAAVRAGIDRDTAHGAVTPPIVLSSNFSFEGFGNKRQYDYTRSGNPTRDLLGEALAELEGGAGGVITATGMGAINLVLNALLQPGDTLVVPHDAYGGSWRLFNALARKGHFELVTADLTDPRALAQALATQPKLVLVETRPTRCCASPTCASSSTPRTRPVPSSWSTTPSCRRPCSSRCRSVRTWCCIRPPSTSMVTVTWSAAPWSRAIRRCTNSWCGGAMPGLTGSPFDAFLTLRGLRTLDALRVHQENTASVVALLDQHPAVGRVYYPGLADHPGHAIAARQQSGFGAMLSFELAHCAGDDPHAAVRAFVDGLRCFTLAESLGGVESLIAHPATMTHAAMSAEARAAAGISEGLLRLSIGIEAERDLLADLGAALRAEAVIDAAARRKQVVDA